MQSHLRFSIHFLYCFKNAFDFIFGIVGEGYEPTFREASEAIWNRRCIATQEGFDQIREVAEECSGAEEEEDFEAEVEGSTSFEPVH